MLPSSTRAPRGRDYYTRDRFYFSKWVTFSCSAILILSAGLPYAFAIYGVALQDSLGYTQQQTAILASAANLGGYMSIFAGIFYDRTKRYKRYGPRLVALVGAVLYVVGFYGMYAAATHRVEMPFWLVLMFVIIANNGGCWLETAGLVTCVRNFETERGAVVGILKSFLGLSASLYTTIYMSFAAPDALRFILVLAIVPPVVTLFAAPGLNFVPFVQVEPHTKSHAFHISLTAIVSMAAYQMVSALFYQHEEAAAFTINRDVNIMLFVAVLGMLSPVICLPLVFGGLRAVPLATEDFNGGPGKVQSPTVPPQFQLASSSGAAQMPLLPESGDDSTDGEDNIKAGTDSTRRRRSQLQTSSQLHSSSFLEHSLPYSTVSTPGSHVLTLHDLQLTQSGRIANTGPDSVASSEESLHVTDRVSFSPFECLVSADFWLLCLVFSVTSGAGLSFVNNMGAISASLNGGADLRAVLVSLSSVASCMGRMTTGFMPEKAFKEYGVPRTYWFILSSILAAASSVMNAYATLDTLPLCSLITGYIFGFIQGLAPTVTSELFGLMHFASNNALVNTSLVAGSMGMAQYLMSSVYAYHVHDGTRCFGQDCFKTGFLICAALCLASTFACLLLSARTRKLYRQLRRSVLRERRKRGVTAVTRNKDMMLTRMDAQLQQAYTELEIATRTLKDVQHLYTHMHAISHESGPSTPHFRDGAAAASAGADAGSELKASASGDLQAKLDALCSTLAVATETLHPSQGVCLLHAGSETESLASTMIV